MHNASISHGIHEICRSFNFDDNVYDSKLKALKDGGFKMNFILNPFQKRQSSKFDKNLLFLN